MPPCSGSLPASLTRRWPRTAGPSRPPSRRCCSTPSATAPSPLCSPWSGCSTRRPGRVRGCTAACAPPAVQSCMRAASGARIACFMGPSGCLSPGAGCSARPPGRARAEVSHGWAGGLPVRRCLPKLPAQPAPTHLSCPCCPTHPPAHLRRQRQGPAVPDRLLPARRRPQGARQRQEGGMSAAACRPAPARPAALHRAAPRADVCVCLVPPTAGRSLSLLPLPAIPCSAPQALHELELRVTSTAGSCIKRVLKGQQGRWPAARNEGDAGYLQWARGSYRACLGGSWSTGLACERRRAGTGGGRDGQCCRGAAGAASRDRKETREESAMGGRPLETAL